MTQERRFLIATAAAAALFAAPAALASGGGGMGGMSMPTPSQATPHYDPAVEYQKGETALQAGKFQEAEHHFDNSLDADPSNAGTLFMLGMARAGKGDEKGAVKAYEKSLKIDDKQIGARREYGVALAKLGQADKAQAQLALLKSQADACAETCPQAADLKAAQAAVQAALSPAGGAAPGKTSLLLIDPQHGDSDYAAAVKLINDHRYQDALAELSRAETAFGPHPDVLTYTGYAWRKLGRYDKAEFYYRAALAIDPDHVGATEYYGELMVERGDLPGARRMLAKLERVCSFGCVESEDLRRWIEHGPPAS
jgi:tetratricopeptide (TPR) repeat protein